MNIFKQMQVMILIFLFISSLIIVDSGQATKMHIEGETPATKIASLSSIDKIPDYLIQITQILKLGQFATVKNMCQQILQLQPDNITARALLAAAHTGLGNQLLAEAEITKIQKIDPGNSVIYIYQAQAFRINEKPEQAIQIYQKGLKQSTEKTELTMLLAGLYKEQGNNKKASNLYRKILQQKNIAPKDYLNASFALCRIDLEEKQYEKVIKQATQVIRNYPPIPKGYTLLATALLKKGNPEKAALVYHKLIQTNPNIAIPYQELALIYLEQLNNSNKALEYARQGALIFPHDAKSQDILGWILYKENKFDEAIQQFQLAVQILPDHATFHYHLGLAQLQTGRKESAKTSFIKARHNANKQNSPNFITEINQRIKECNN